GSGEKVDGIEEFLKQAKPRTGTSLTNVFFWAWGLLVLGLIPYFLWPGPGTFALSFLITTSRMGALMTLSHEAQHRALLPSEKWNDRVGAWLCAYPMASIFNSAKAMHSAHH